MLTTSTEEIHSVAKKAIVAQYRECRNDFFIWNNFSGGDSAHAVTMAIFTELGIDVTSPSCQAYVS